MIRRTRMGDTQITSDSGNGDTDPDDFIQCVDGRYTMIHKNCGATGLTDYVARLTMQRV